MPQPLSRVVKTDHVKLGSPEHLGKHPELALHAMKVIAGASSVEAGFARIFVSLMGAEPGPGAAIYLSLSAENARRAALRAAAAQVLSARDAELFEALLAFGKQVVKLRHKLAHWLWGSSPDVPDGLLICDPAELIGVSVQSATFAMAVAEQKIAALPEISHDKIFVLRLDELVQTGKQMERMRKFILDFEHIFRLSVMSPPQDSSGEYVRLCKEPEIASELARLRKQNKGA